MVKLYSTHCPKCNQLIKQLNAASIPFEEIDDIDYMKGIGLGGSMPKLGLEDGTILEFPAA